MHQKTFTLPQVAVILVWASLSSAVFGTFIGLAVAFTSLSVGAGLAGACVMVIVAVMVISHRIFRQQGSGGRRRASYTRPMKIRRRENLKGCLKETSFPIPAQPTRQRWL